MPDVSEIEALAIKAEEMPKSYALPEQQLYLGLRILHEEYRRGEITRKQATDEKVRLVEEYQRVMRWLEIYRTAVEIRNTMSWKFAAIEKDGCPLCRELVRIFDGRIQPTRKEDIHEC